MVGAKVGEKEGTGVAPTRVGDVVTKSGVVVIGPWMGRLVGSFSGTSVSLPGEKRKKYTATNAKTTKIAQEMSTIRDFILLDVYLMESCLISIDGCSISAGTSLLCLRGMLDDSFMMYRQYSIMQVYLL